MFSHTIPSMSSSDPQKNKKTNCSQQPFVRKKNGRKTTTCLKVMLTFKEVSELSSFNPELPQLYNQSIVGSDVNVTIFNTSEVGSSRCSDVCLGSIFVVCAFFVSENLVTAWIWAWNHSLTKWMVYHDGWLAAMFIILKMRKLIYRRQPFLTSGLYRWSSQRNLWCSSADWESGEPFRWKLGQNSLEQFHSSWRYFIHPV